MKILKSLMIVGLLSIVLVACNNNTKKTESKEDVPGEIIQKNDGKRIKPVHYKVYTRSSNGKNLYNGNAQDIMGFISPDITERKNVKSIGKIGTIDAQGNIEITLPDEISDSLLSRRGTDDILGGVLITQPNLQLWKADNDIVVLTYLNRDYQYIIEGKDYGVFPKGWSYARMNDHLPRTDYADYKWVIFDNDAKIQYERTN
ncbi:MAG: hypothetical protein JST47_15910 [Bacteroidetes bacterium]|nr:hypothetical protein [Bacteroidota bacterium]